MSASKHFIDTNVLLHLLSGDPGKADRAEQLIQAGGTISVQVLNEFASVASRKLKMSIAEIREILETIREVLEIAPLTEESHTLGLRIGEQYLLSIDDAMIVSAALLAGCSVLWSEDMHHGLVVDRSLVIQNPFR
ncbi:PIN domain-containing protein [Candidatus Accumulibacter sp. ACC003]|uniref:PIN domain-containing protein n=1 Tax=Candidatus Accumulibacter sp. ACC003 TaxID=2823334 RepID=UPI0025B8265F|nr:PIN domain-containing protein [Candidatus Accumulibacter sp. ACC003]